MLQFLAERPERFLLPVHPGECPRADRYVRLNAAFLLFLFFKFISQVLPFILPLLAFDVLQLIDWGGGVVSMYGLLII